MVIDFLITRLLVSQGTQRERELPKGLFSVMADGPNDAWHGAATSFAFPPMALRLQRSVSLRSRKATPASPRNPFRLAGPFNQPTTWEQHSVLQQPGGSEAALAYVNCVGRLQQSTTLGALSPPPPAPQSVSCTADHARDAQRRVVRAQQARLK